MPTITTRTAWRTVLTSVKSGVKPGRSNIGYTSYFYRYMKHIYLRYLTHWLHLVKVHLLHYNYCMKTIIMTLILICLLETKAHAWASWSTEDKALFVTEVILAGVDVYQTAHFQEYQIKEANPIFKPYYDRPAALIAAMTFIHVAEYIFLDRNPEMRKILPWQVSAHFAIVAWNRHVIKVEAGVNIPF